MPLFHLNRWKWSRLPLLSQAILLMSYAHFYYVEKVDKRIVINIAVELAKNISKKNKPNLLMQWSGAINGKCRCSHR